MNGEEGRRFRRFKLGCFSSSWGGPTKRAFLACTSCQRGWRMRNHVGSALVSVQVNCGTKEPSSSRGLLRLGRHPGRKKRKLKCATRDSRAPFRRRVWLRQQHTAHALVPGVTRYESTSARRNAIGHSTGGGPSQSEVQTKHGRRFDSLTLRKDQMGWAGTSPLSRARSLQQDLVGLELFVRVGPDCSQ